MPQRILLITAGIYAELCSEFLKREGYDVLVAENSHQCFDALARERFDLVISTNLDVVNGLPYDIIPEIRRVLPHVPILAITGYNPEGFLDELVKRGADYALEAPTSQEDLIEKVKELTKEAGDPDYGLGQKPLANIAPEEGFSEKEIRKIETQAFEEVDADKSITDEQFDAAFDKRVEELKHAFNINKNHLNTKRETGEAEPDERNQSEDGGVNAEGHKPFHHRLKGAYSKTKKFVVPVTILLLLLTTISVVQYLNDTKNRQLENEVRALRDRVAVLESHLKEADSKFEEAEFRLEESQSKIEELERKLEELEGKVDEVEWESRWRR